MGVHKLFNYNQHYSKYTISTKIAEELVNSKNYKFICIVRNPYSRLYSGIVNKFMTGHKHLKNYKIIIDNNNSRNVANVYDWYKNTINNDINSMTLRYFIDFHCKNIEHDYPIDPHFLPISEIIPSTLLCKKENIHFIIENDAIGKMFKILNITQKKLLNIHKSKSNYIDDGNFNEKKYLDSIYTIYNIVKKSNYYRKSVAKRFRHDFEFFGYDI